jgi:hypothetical protein
LDEMLAFAMKENPEIRVAEAKVREAEEEVRRARLTVSQKIVTCYHAIEEAKRLLREYTARWETAQKLRQQGGKLISDEEYRGAQVSFEHARAELPKLEAELPYLIGRAPTTAHRVDLRLEPVYQRIPYQVPLETHFVERFGIESVRPSSSRPAPTGSTADKLREALDKPVSMTFKSTPMNKVAAELQTRTGVTVQLAPGADAVHFSVTLDFQSMPLGAAFQLLQDASPGVHYIVRDYGILAAPVASIPPGALTVHEYWKQNKQKAANAEALKAK